MRTLKWTILLIFMLAETLHAQKLADLYAKPIVKLEAIPEYGSQNNWNDIFSDYEKMFAGRSIGKMKQITVAPDGSIFMTDKTTYSISKFDKNGTFLKRIGKKGGKNNDFLYDPDIAGILDNKYIVTADCQGRVQLFTLNGDFYKLVNLKFMPLGQVTLKNSHIALINMYSLKGGKQVEQVIIKNLETEAEKVVWQSVTNEVDKSITIMLPDNMGAMTWSLPYTHSGYTRPQLACSKNGNLLVASPRTGEITEYTTAGVKVKSFKIDIDPLQLSDEDLKEFNDGMKKCAEQFEASLAQNPKMTAEERKAVAQQFHSQVRSKAGNKDLYPTNLPYFSSFMVDSDDNLLLFEFTKEESNKFKVYTLNKEGKAIGTSQFSCDGYDLSFMPEKFTFHNGYIYAVGMQKNGGSMPLRLVKFKLSN